MNEGAIPTNIAVIWPHLDNVGLKPVSSPTPKRAYIASPFGSAGYLAWLQPRRARLTWPYSTPKGSTNIAQGNALGINATKHFPALKGLATLDIMPQSLARVLVHLIYSTKNRERLLTEAVRDELHRYSAAVFKSSDCPAILINSVEDHVHCVFCLARTAAISDVVEEVKKSTSKWIKAKGPEFTKFHWQSGYGAFSISQSNLDQVLKYVANQAEHHRRKTFQEEYREFLIRHDVPFDERYVWD